MTVIQGGFTFIRKDGVISLSESESLNMGNKISLQIDSGTWGRNQWCSYLAYLAEDNLAIAAFRNEIPVRERRLALAAEFYSLMAMEGR